MTDAPWTRLALLQLSFTGDAAKKWGVIVEENQDTKTLGSHFRPQIVLMVPLFLEKPYLTYLIWLEP